MKRESRFKNLMLTRFGSETLAKETPFCEYPRPQMRRDSYLCLNGKWMCTIADASGKAKYDGEIYVPYSPESLLSGVIKVVEPADTLKYGAEFEIPEGFLNDVTLLNFGAVDYECAVELNGKSVGGHRGGYTAFTLDVTAAIKPGVNKITVTVKDPSDTGVQAHGKQKLKNGGIWYTPQSGIWQTAWIESVPTGYISDMTIIPDIDAGTLTVKLEFGGSYVAGNGTAPINVIKKEGSPAATGNGGTPVTATKNGAVQAEEGARNLDERSNSALNSAYSDTPVLRGGRALIDAYDDGILIASAVLKDGVAALKLPGFECWSPEHPKLYDLKITSGEDTVYSYFAMRKFSIGLDGAGVKRLLLNNKPYFHKGVLDQGYWSDGLMTPPSDEAMVYDITLMKKLGFNMLRKHIKIEPARWYYHCDRIGMLVWQDMVSGGGKTSFWTIAAEPFIGIHKNDTRWYGAFGRKDAAGRAEFERDCVDTVKQLKNAPCIAMWVPFNEGWGQFDSVRITNLIKSLDATRTVDSVSGWHDQGAEVSEIKSLHVYFRAVKLPIDEKRLIVLSEFGGYSFKTQGHVYDTEHEFGYKKFGTRADFEKAYAALIENEILPAIGEGLSATVYTQLSDVEQEVNGFVTYDRAEEKADRVFVKTVNDKIKF
ncbi:MAG: glycoside hydrolase family 2 [Clostridiaceae bacterium]|jgi:hypothetical protein|nr:glycoside hydrolase family 2 [Clostridiaceae bacterium]